MNKTILSSLQFHNILGLFERSNKGGRCLSCGCPDFISIVKGEHNKYKWETHFVKCPEIKSLRSDEENKNFRVVKGRIQFKDIVIDEVYECRWDCYTKSGRA